MQKIHQLSLINKDTQLPEQWEHLPKKFISILFERVCPEKNENKFYWLAWQPTLIDDWAVVRMHGRKDGFQRVLSPTPFRSLAEAWPVIKRTIRARVQRGYTIVDCH
ncbi:MAG: WGR domain-containing protein [Anaerolineae bacterium]|nr:WGR domain-containing protein [Anaerolineae bacterium]